MKLLRKLTWPWRWLRNSESVEALAQLVEFISNTENSAVLKVNRLEGEISAKDLTIAERDGQIKALQDSLDQLITRTVKAERDLFVRTGIKSTL